MLTARGNSLARSSRFATTTHQICLYPPSLTPTNKALPLTLSRKQGSVKELQLHRLVHTAASTQGPASEQPQASSKDYFQTDARPIILYDGVCNLCNGAVNIMLDLDPEGKRFRMAALQSPAGRALLQRCGRRPDDISSIVLVEPNYKGHIRSEAILRIASGLSNPFPFLAFLGFPVPPFIRDALYDQVANNRYSFFGQSNTCRLSNAGQEHRFIVE